MNERQKTESTDQVIADLKKAHQRELAKCKEDNETQIKAMQQDK